MAVLATACGARPATSSPPREASGGAGTDEIVAQTTTGTGAIAGVVIDAKTHEAIAGSTIVVAMPTDSRQVVSATSGHYEIPALPPGSYLERGLPSTAERLRPFPIPVPLPCSLFHERCANSE